ncbi:MAG: ROK family protein [Bacteroidaceae bacterium]|nr:ROK family protein [Bacteroidaceae bacterium]
MDEYEFQKLTSLKPYVIGLGIREMSTVFGIVDALGNIKCMDKVKTRDYADPTALVFDICDRLQPLVEQCGGWGNIKAMGISAASGNNITHRIENAANLPWKGKIAMASMFQGRLGISVALVNDCTAAAMGEMIYGAARGLKDYICIWIDGGLGAGLVLNGLTFMGNKGRVGEIGHVTLDPNGRHCTCGKVGCLESYVSRRGIRQTLCEIMEEKPDVPTRFRDVKPDDITVEAVAEAAEAGDALALETLAVTGNIFGHAMTAWASLVSPEAFVLTGGVANLCGKYMLPSILEGLNENMFAPMRWTTKVYVSNLHGDKACILYGSAVAWQTHEYDMVL